MNRRAITSLLRTSLLVATICCWAEILSAGGEEQVNVLENDPRREIVSALNFYADLLEKKEVDRFLSVALKPDVLKGYMEDAAEFAAMKEALNGDTGNVEVRTMRMAAKLKPEIAVVGLLKERRATFEWTDKELGLVRVVLTMPSLETDGERGVWYLKW